MCARKDENTTTTTTTKVAYEGSDGGREKSSTGDRWRWRGCEGTEGVAKKNS